MYPCRFGSAFLDFFFFIRDKIRNTTYAALITKAAGDIPDPSDY